MTVETNNKCHSNYLWPKANIGNYIFLLSGPFWQFSRGVPKQLWLSESGQSILYNCTHQKGGAVHCKKTPFVFYYLICLYIRSSETSSYLTPLRSASCLSFHLSNYLSIILSMCQCPSTMNICISLVSISSVSGYIDLLLLIILLLQSCKHFFWKYLLAYYPSCSSIGLCVD